MKGLLLLLVVLTAATAAAEPLQPFAVVPSALLQVHDTVRAGDEPSVTSREIKLANTGLKTDGTPVRGVVVGPFNSVRSTTIPWNLRHMMGQQVNGAPEPLVYSPVYQFKVTEHLHAETPMEMFKNKNLYKLNFQTANQRMTLMGQTSASAGRGGGMLDPKAFEIVAPQPPPFVSPTPPGANAGAAAASLQVAPQQPMGQAPSTMPHQ